MKDMLLKDLSGSIALLTAVITSVLYVSGVSYLDYYLTAWGVESNIITTSLIENMKMGAEILTGSAVVPLSLIALLALLSYALIDGFTMILKPSTESKIWHSFITILNKIFGTPPSFKYPEIVTKILNILAAILKPSFVGIFIIILYYLIISTSKNLGVSRATVDYINFSSHQYEDENIFHRMKTYGINGKLKKGYLIASDNISYIIYFPSTCTNKETLEIVNISKIGVITATKQLKVSKIKDTDTCIKNIN